MDYKTHITPSGLDFPYPKNYNHQIPTGSNSKMFYEVHHVIV